MISGKDILDVLALEPHRCAFSDEEEVVREGVLTLLAGEPFLSVQEEGHVSTGSDLYLLAVTAAVMLLSLWVHPLAGGWSTVIVLLAPLLWLWTLDMRSNPMIWLGAGKVGTNLVLERDDGGGDDQAVDRQEVLVVTTLDTAPACLQRWVSLSVRQLSLIMGAGLCLPGLVIGLFAPEPTFAVLAAFSVWIPGLVLVWALPRWRGEPPRRSDEEDAGTAAAILTILKLVRRPPKGLSVRGLVLGSGAAHHIGLRYFLTSHKKALQERESMVLEVGPIGGGPLGYGQEAGFVFARPAHGHLAAVMKEARLSPLVLRTEGTAHLLARNIGLDAVAVAAAGGPTTTGEIAERVEETARILDALVRAAGEGDEDGVH